MIYPTPTMLDHGDTTSIRCSVRASLVLVLSTSITVHCSRICLWPIRRSVATYRKFRFLHSSESLIPLGTIPQEGTFGGNVGYIFGQDFEDPKQHHERAPLSVKSLKTRNNKTVLHDSLLRNMSRVTLRRKLQCGCLFVSVKGYKISRLEIIITRQTTPPSTTSCCIRIQCPASTHHPLYVSVDVGDSLSRDFQEWYIPDEWPSRASDILNEQALEERAHPLMISDPPACLCFY